MERDFAHLLTLCRQALPLVSGASAESGGLAICADSRAVKPGDIFVAVPGVTEDGARYIPAAVAAGASVIVCRSTGPEAAAAEAAIATEAASCRVVHCADPREGLWQLAQARFRTDESRIKILGVTGTNGKTTCSYLLERLFSAAGQKVGVMGTVNYRWPGHSEEAPLTTPDPVRIHANLAAMSAAGVDVAVMEVSSHALEQRRVGGVNFDGALFTNLTQDHLDYHKDMESYFKAKAGLFVERPRPDKAAAVNADDTWGRRLLEFFPRALSFGLHKSGAGRRHLWGELLSAGTDGCHLRMQCDGHTWELRSPLVGAFNASNLLAVQALGLEMGLAPERFAALEGFTGVSGRLERVDNPQGLNIFVDYAHTPDALVNVLKALRAAGFKRIVAVFGCGGNRDRTKRPLMGEAVARYADVAVLTSDNPRFEDPEAILQDVLPGLSAAAEVLVEVDRRAATAKALNMLGEGAALLIAGKGHENYQIIQGVKHHYSDREVVQELLNCA